MIAGKSLLAGNLQEDIVTRFENYFALFDDTSEPKSQAKIWQAVNELFDDSVLEEQLDLAQEMLDKQTHIKVHRIEKCHTGRIFYHLKVPTAQSRTQHYVTGFATMNNDCLVIDVETRARGVKSRGLGRRLVVASQ